MKSKRPEINYAINWKIVCYYTDRITAQNERWKELCKVRKQTSIHYDKMYSSLFYLFSIHFTHVFCHKTNGKENLQNNNKDYLLSSNSILKISHHLIEKTRRSETKTKLFIHTLTHSRTNEENLFIFIRTWCLIEHFWSKHKGDKKKSHSPDEVLRIFFAIFIFLFLCCPHWMFTNYSFFSFLSFSLSLNFLA